MFWLQLETLKNHLTKGSENEPIINQTYNPEESSPRIPKRTLRDKASIEEETNNVVSKGESKQVGLKKKKKAALQKQLNEEEKVSETKLDSSEKQIQVFTKKKTGSVLQADAVHWEGDSNVKGALSGLRDRSGLDEEEEQLIQAYEQQVAEEEASAIKKKIKKKLKEQMSEFIPSAQSHETMLNSEVRKKKKKKKEVLVSSESQTRYNSKW